MVERKMPKYVVLERVSHDGLWIGKETNEYQECLDYVPMHGKKVARYVRVE